MTVIDSLSPLPSAAVVASTVTPVAAAPVITAAPVSAPTSGAVSGLGANLLSWLASGNGGDSPAAAPLAWAALAYTRRELARSSRTAPSAAVTTSGAPVNPAAATPLIDSASFVGSPSAAATGAWQPGQLLGGLISFFFSNGTAEHPEAGLLVGNGYSRTAQTCTGGASCTGGNAGLIGNGGNGYNAGDGGSAVWFGNGGKGGDAVTVANGGTGGTGGRFTGDGGNGGNGGVDGIAGTGGRGGLIGASGVSGAAGAGATGAIGATGPTGATGATGDTGATVRQATPVRQARPAPGGR